MKLPRRNFLHTPLGGESTGSISGRDQRHYAGMRKIDVLESALPLRSNRSLGFAALHSVAIGTKCTYQVTRLSASGAKRTRTVA
jgi:hypothetical protein